MKNTKDKGITVIALIITIIVMLILVAVTVNVAINEGLFNVTKEAKIKTEMETIRERAETVKATLYAEATKNKDIKFDMATYKLRLKEEFNDSKIGLTKVIVENEKYDIVILNGDLEIEVRIHNNEDSFMIKKDISSGGQEYLKYIEWDNSIAVGADIGTKQQIIDGSLTHVFNYRYIMQNNGTKVYNNLDEIIQNNESKNLLGQFLDVDMSNVSTKIEAYKKIIEVNENIDNSISTEELIEKLYYYNFGTKTEQEMCLEFSAGYVYKDGQIIGIKINLVDESTDYFIKENGNYEIIIQSITGQELAREKITCENFVENKYEFILPADGCFPVDGVDWYNQPNKGYWKTDGNGTIIECRAIREKLPEIVIPYRVGNEKITAISNGVFEGWPVKKVIIPNDVQIIGERAFAKCTNLEMVSLPPSLKTIEESAFEECSNLSEILLTSVSSIERHAFFECKNIKQITLPDTLKTIVIDAFIGTGINEIYIPENVIDIKVNKLNEFMEYDGRAYDTYTHGFGINVSENNKVYSSSNGILFNKDKTELIDYPYLKEETTYTIPNTVKTIKEGAFLFSKLTEINIPSNVKKIEDLAFAYSYLSNINIEEGLEEIGYGGFAELWYMQGKDVYLPNSITYIGEVAFFPYYSSGYSIANIYFAPGNNPIPEGAPWGSKANVVKLEN